MRRILSALLFLTLAGALFLLPASQVLADTQSISYDVEFDGYTYDSGQTTWFSTGGVGNTGYLRGTNAAPTNNCTTASQVVAYIPVNPYDTLTHFDTKLHLTNITASVYVEITLTQSGETVETDNWLASAIGSNWLGSTTRDLDNWTGGSSVRLVASICWTGTSGVYVGVDNTIITYTAGTGPTATYTPTPTVTPTATATSVPGWAMPFRAADRAPQYVEMIDAYTANFVTLPQLTAYASIGDDDYNANVELSTQAALDVFAATSGTVTAVNPVGSQCSGTYLDPFPDYCRVQTAILIAPAQAFYVDIDIGSGQTLRYLVANPQVAVDDAVSSGCLIGKALPAKVMTSAWGQYDDFGATLIQWFATATEQTITLYGQLTNEPAGVACNISDASYSCALINNPTFDTQSGWEFIDTGPGGGAPVGWYPEPGGRSWIDPAGSGMIPVGYVQQFLYLDPATSYGITIQYANTGEYGESSFQVQLGAETPTVIHWTNTENANVLLETVIDPQTWEPSSTDPDWYYLSIAGLTNAIAFRIKFICVWESSGPPAPAGNCIVLDPNLDQTTTDSPWNFSSSPAPTFTEEGGAILMPNGSYIVPPDITLNPMDGGAQQAYKMELVYRRQGAAESLHAIHPEVSWSGISLYDLPDSLDQTTWTTNYIEFVVQTSPANDDLTIAAEGTAGDVLQLSRVCITTADGSPPPGYQPPPIIPNCRACEFIPTGDMAMDFPEFVSWIACKIFQVYDCDMKKILINLMNAVIGILTFFGMFRIWLGISITNAWTAMGGNLIVITSWLDSEFVNLRIGFQNALTSVVSINITQGGSGAGFWDALIALFNAVRDLGTTIINNIVPLLQQIINGLFGLAGDLIAFLGSFFNLLILLVSTQAALLIGTLVNIITALVTGFNHAAVAMPPGALTCDTPGTFLYYPCLGFYVLDNTIFSGPIMYVFPLWMGITAIKLLLWGIGRIKRAFAW